jgi:hypothetical protein
MLLPSLSLWVLRVVPLSVGMCVYVWLLLVHL